MGTLPSACTHFYLNFVGTYAAVLTNCKRDLVTAPTQSLYIIFAACYYHYLFCSIVIISLPFVLTGQRLTKIRKPMAACISVIKCNCGKWNLSEYHLRICGTKDELDLLMAIQWQELKAEITCAVLFWVFLIMICSQVRGVVFNSQGAARLDTGVKREVRDRWLVNIAVRIDNLPLNIIYKHAQHENGKLIPQR